MSKQAQLVQQMAEALKVLPRSIRAHVLIDRAFYHRLRRAAGRVTPANGRKSAPKPA